MALIPTGAARATTYTFTSGYATVTATYAAATIAGPANIPLTGTQVTFNTGPASLTSFDFDAAGPNVIPLVGALAGHSITLSNVQIAPGAGPPPYTNYSVTGGPSTFNYVVGPVDVTGTAVISGPSVNTAGPFAYTNPSLSGQIQTGPGTLTLNGITLGVIAVPASGPFLGGNVTVKADIVFTGVPEPGTALLLGGGLVLAAAAGRRGRRC